MIIIAQPVTTSLFTKRGALYVFRLFTNNDETFAQLQKRCTGYFIIMEIV